MPFSKSHCGKDKHCFSTTFPQDQRVDPSFMSLRVLRLAWKWSGRWESNPHGRSFRVFETSGLAQMLMPSVIMLPPYVNALLRQVHLLEQCLEARIAVQAIEQQVDFDL
jgi:hypothetical protein